MTKSQLLSKLTSDLKTYIKSSGHVDSGKLLKSVKVISGPELDFKVVAMEYILYLDDGKFINSFFELPATQELIQSYIISTVNQTINDELNL